MAKCVVCKKTTEYKQIYIGHDKPTYICKKCIPEPDYTDPPGINRNYGELLDCLERQYTEKRNKRK